MKRRLLNDSEKGLTLLESLVGIMVVAVVISLITPALVVGYASRIKNYRTDQAIKLARGEIDRVRLEVERGNYTNLPPTLGQTVDRFDLDSQVPAPTPNPNPPACPLNATAATSVTEWCAVDINGDGQQNWDLGVQTFTSSTPAVVYQQVRGKPVAFLMGVRVYTRAALISGSLKPYPRRETASGGLTSGQVLSLPLVTFYTPIVKSDLPTSRFAYCELNNKIQVTSANCN
ncbi:type II secretion system GspH family protein [Ancylothrix sp. C2]|uniref:type II secretion system protein n=1 Tax=Ancylothrix sp. D3o TaxID=2953691 RepID=UPI0021BBA23F|nr:type II secretion system protein [Ancylothrix sp. D3o]MCT7948581.1 type II secretion system GspH family protein [Ancylothrix sp. D3o]